MELWYFQAHSIPKMLTTWSVLVAYFNITFISSLIFISHEPCELGVATEADQVSQTHIKELHM